MSDNVSDEEQQQQMKEISICADIWLEIFALVSPRELGHLMALISDRFDVLVDEHFKLRKWSLGSLDIRRAIGGNGAEIVKSSGEVLPIPQRPLPNKVIGFEHIQISYVDQTAIEFLQRIRRLFDAAETTVYAATFLDDQSRSREIICQKIWPLFNDNICRFASFRLDHLRQFSPAILRNCPNLRSLSCYGLFPELPAEDNAGASSRQAVAKWLLTAREDGLPKTLCCCVYSGGMDEFKRSFVNASGPVNFIVIFEIDEEEDDDFVPFELENNLTGERMTLRQMDEVNWRLVRCPIGREETKWAKWEEEAIDLDWWDYQWNCISIDFKDRDLGYGKVKAKAGRMCLIA